MRTAENMLPKLVVAPGFVLGFAFIYGLMIWNGVFAIPVVAILERIDLWTEDDYSDRFMGRIGVY